MTTYQSNSNALVISKEDHILWLTLNRPESSNAFDDELINDLVSNLELADCDDSVRVIVITGEGKCFCAGGDVKAMQNKTGMFAGESSELMLRYQRGIQRIPKMIESMRTPLIAMVNGPAIGAGLDLACMCDLRIASTKAKFGETFCRLGLIPGDGGTFFLSRVVGYPKAMEMTLTAQVYSPEEALKMGLITTLVEPAKLKETVKKLAKQISLNAPISTQMAKQALKISRTNELSSVLELLSAYQGISQRSADHFEGIEALLNKRDPNFQGN